MKKNTSDNSSVMSGGSGGSGSATGYRTRNKVKEEKEEVKKGLKKSSSGNMLSRSTSVVSTNSEVPTGSDISGSTVQVTVRVRPLLNAEIEREEPLAWLWGSGEDNTITQDPQHIPKRAAYNKDGECPSTAPAGFTFDHLHIPDSTNEHIYEANVHNIVQQTLKGYHGSVFTYGQTSSGKTYTMNGTLKQPGIIPQAIYDCFKSIHLYKDREFLFRVSYLEIYNETVNDLLNPDPKAQVKIQHDPKAGTILSGVKEQVVMNPAQVVALLQGGEAYRHVSSTEMNDKSSRAHTLFKLIVESKAINSGSGRHVRVSTLNLVDLAGSENAKMTNSTGERAREAKFINQSLLTLSTIIHKLSEESVRGGGAGKRKGPMHMPYRDSKLTRILQTALSGNAHITIICTISPTVKCSEESHNTLKFASRAKKIKMKATVNESVDDKTLLSQYREEIDQLKAQLAMFQEMSSNSFNVALGSAHKRDVPESETDADAENNDEDTEQNQRLILQMIGHMERLILKGENVSDKALKPLTSPKGKNKMIDRRRSDVSISSSSTYKRNGGLTSAGTLLPTWQSSPDKSSHSHGSGSFDEKGDNQPDLSCDSTDHEPNFKEIAEVEIENPFKNIIEENIPPPEDEGHNEQNDIDNDDFFAGLSRLSVCGSPSRSRTSSHEKHQLFSSPSASKLGISGSPQSEVKKNVSDKRPTRQKFVLNPRRVTMSFGEGGMRKLVKSSSDVDGLASLISSGSMNIEEDPDDMLNSSLHEEDPVLQGVSQMLSILKQHVTKPKVKHNPQLKDRAGDGGSLSRSSVGTLPEVNTKSLYDEIARLQENIDKKDSMLSMLTEGLKEVEVNQAALLASNEELGEELHVTQQAYYEVEEENKLIRAEVERLQKCLDTRERQFFDVTGKKPEEEEF